MMATARRETSVRGTIQRRQRTEGWWYRHVTGVEGWNGDQEECKSGEGAVKEDPLWLSLTKTRGWLSRVRLVRFCITTSSNWRHDVYSRHLGGLSDRNISISHQLSCLSLIDIYTVRKAESRWPGSNSGHHTYEPQKFTKNRPTFFA